MTELMQNLQNFGRNRLRSISPPKTGRSISPPKLNSGRLFVTVVEAKNLHPKDKKDVVSDLSDAFGFSSEDPYCKVTVGKKTYKTSAKSSTLHPRWNERFIFESVEPNAELKFVLRDNLTIGKGHFFGEVILPISAIKKQNGEIDEWFTLCKRKTIDTDVRGEIHLKIYFQPESAKPENRDSLFMEISRGPVPEDVSETPSAQGLLSNVHPQEIEDDSAEESSATDNSTQSSQVYTNIPSKEEREDDASPALIGSVSMSSLPSAKSKPLPRHTPTASLSADDFAAIQTTSVPSSPGGFLRKRASLKPDKISPPTSGSESVSSFSNYSSAPSTSFDPLSKELISRADSKKVDSKKAETYIKRFNLPPTENLLKSFSAALHKQILLHGRLYLSKDHFCFHSNIFGIKTTEVIPISTIVDLKKTFYNLSLGIQVTTSNNKNYIFASFFSRDKAYNWMIKIWKGAQELAVSDKNQSQDKKEEDVDSEEEEEISNDIEDDDKWEDAFLSLDDLERGFLNTESSQRKQLATVELPITVLNFFRLFYSDGAFAKQFHEQRGDKDVIVKEWTTSPQFGTTRELHYRVSLNYPIGPSSAPCQETQRYHLTKTQLLVETILMTSDIPYGDYFRVEGKWLITPAANPNNCNVTHWVGVHFMKKPLFKGKIESGSLKESEEAFQIWLSLARKEIAKASEHRRSIITGKTDSPGQSPSTSTANLGLPQTTPIEIAPNPKSTSKNSLNQITGIFSVTDPVPLLVGLVMLFIIIALYILGVLDPFSWVVLIMITLLVVRSYQLEQRFSNLENEIRALRNKT